MSLSVHNLHFSYTNKRVLRGVSFEQVPRGKLTALIGPNAVGKSTLFRCIVGMQKTDPGTVLLNDQDLHVIGRQRRSQAVCFMPQHFASNAALSVFEVVLLARKHMQGWRVDDDDVFAVEQGLQRLGIEHLAETYIGELSGGQQQLVSVCQALVRSPSLYLLDEPTSALDLRHQLEVMNTLRTMTAERDISTIIALHDLNLAARFAEHLLLMQDGRVVAAGRPDELLTSPVLSEVYGVSVELAYTRDGTIVVAASL